MAFRDYKQGVCNFTCLRESGSLLLCLMIEIKTDAEHTCTGNSVVSKLSGCTPFRDVVRAPPPLCFLLDAAQSCKHTLICDASGAPL